MLNFYFGYSDVILFNENLKVSIDLSLENEVSRDRI